MRTVAPVGYRAEYLRSGHIIFVRGDALWAQPVDPITLVNNGDAVPVIFDLELYEQFGNAGFALSQSDLVNTRLFDGKVCNLTTAHTRKPSRG